MTIRVEITGALANGELREAGIHQSNGDVGLKVFSEPRHLRSTQFIPAFNPDFGIEMAIDASFGGTPVGVHNGTDSVEWAGTSVTGIKFTFDSTDEAFAGTKSVKTNRAVLNDVMQFDRGSDLDLTGYTAITLHIRVASGWSPLSADSVSIYGWDVGAGVQVGNAVLLENFFIETLFNTWHKITIPLSVMSLENISSGFDALRIEIVAKSGPGPVFYIDNMQIEETGAAETFAIVAPKGKKLEINSIAFTFIAAIDTTLADASMPNLSYDQILSLPKLDNGILFARIDDGEIIFSVPITCIADSTRGGAEIINEFADATNAHITLNTEFISPIILDSRKKDAITVTISDDLTGLISFTVISRGAVYDIVDN